jgi:hypothetical protein
VLLPTYAYRNGGLSRQGSAQSGTFKTKKVEFDVMLFMMFFFINNEFTEEIKLLKLILIFIQIFLHVVTA